MEIQLNDYHKKVNAQKMASMAYWREHPLSLEECLAQFKRLREQRLARQGGRIKMRSPPKVLTGNFRPSQLSFFLS